MARLSGEDAAGDAWDRRLTGAFHGSRKCITWKRSIYSITALSPLLRNLPVTECQKLGQFQLGALGGTLCQ
jgi:hypothetical protein